MQMKTSTPQVLIIVNLDHCIKPDDVELALTLPVDSITADASTLDEEANVRYCKGIVDRARALDITIEAEMGRIEGGEDALPTADMGAVMTRPEDAETFVRQTGVPFLATSFGNIHGAYPAGGAEEAWDLERYSLAAIGTLKSIACGVRKINLNRRVRDDYTRLVAQNAGSLELTFLKVQAVDIYAKSIERMMDVLGSSGRY
ncbi:hypothetical protein BBP40_001526 [Aspergillus hancockii]|nr:hypothetical protein BBP40_001526 [Aspergillus hancockii]